MNKRKRSWVSAYGLILREDQILLCRISSELPQWEGLWTLPGGGIEFGEDPESAMIREVKEETGLEVVPVAVVKVDSILDEKEEEDFHWIRIIYQVEVVGGELAHEFSGTTDLCQWHPIEVNEERLVGLAVAGLRYMKANKEKAGWRNPRM